ncbi:hypothetical protein [Streptomyces ureilyticus]|uniref:Uncharacterized protein n=1 Tax=Streptomyces ureilyticus TaxID=1775131 RepID=A0ABX0DPK0_9ACTN|nr:hypothetical protein [Streptomyces ureilyticus]NGO43796.1 hypothetical protein [Streptomyces ureilyticus]
MSIMADPPDGGHIGEALRRARAADEPLAKECAHWIGAERRHCRSTENVRPYLTGLCCPLHTPRALRGLPEIPPGPGIPAYRNRADS